MDRFHTNFGLAIVFSQLTHLFCCGLPVLFSVLSLLSGLGFVGTMPESMESVHEIVHEWETVMLIGSGIILALGWALYLYSRKIDCSKTDACSHKPCSPKKKYSRYILIVASVLFAVNISIFLFLEG